LFAIVCVVTGMALGADLALPPAIQADVVDYDRWRNKQERTGLQFALWGMSTKLALALSVGIALPALDAFGFDANSPKQDGIMALIVIYAVVPVVIKLIAILVVWNFPLTPQKLTVIQHRLLRRKHAN
jgi:GPH family glycoside/pentoside/hexuronide:cation symporter